MSEEKLVPWIRNQILINRGSGPVVRIELRHVPDGASKYGNEVDTIDGVSSDPEENWFQSVAAQLYSSACSDAQSLTGCQAYALCVYRKNKPDKITARHLFRVDGGDDFEDGDSGVRTEPATKQGFFAQVMRHSDAQQKVLMSSIGVVMSNCTRALAQVAAQNEKLQEAISKQQEQRLESIQVVEDLLSQRLQRELEAEREKTKQRMLGELVSEVKLLGPAIVNRIAGKEVVPSPVDTKALAVQRFVESLDDSQKATIAQTLRPEQQIALGEMLTGLEKKEGMQ